MRFKSISVFFPVYNEAHSIAGLTLKTIGLLDRIAEDYEILIVNNASSDDSGQIADSLADRYKQVKVIHHPQNSGPGLALKRGFETAQKEFVFYTDSDAQYEIDELEGFLPYIKEADAVIGYREKRADPVLRKAAARLYGMLNRVLFGLAVKDIDCSFKLIKRSVLEKIKFESGSAFIDAELLLKLNRLGCPIKEVAVTHYPRPYGKSKCFRIDTIFSMLKDMIKMRLKRNKR